MKLLRTWIPIVLAAGCALRAGAQTSAPQAAPAPPGPEAVPLAPEPPDLTGRLQDLRENLRLNLTGVIVREQIQEVGRLVAEVAVQAAQAAPAVPAAPASPAERVREQTLRLQEKVRQMRPASDDRLYDQGQRALDNHRYADALTDFDQVAAHAGARADGATYWKAYTLIKLGRRDEALAAIADLRKSYPNSRWLDDAKALELEAGKPVSPESESDEELKLIALNGLMQSDPDRALPLLENLLKGNQPPNLKKRVVYVLALSNAPKAQQLLVQVARGQGNPDLQLAAIQYLPMRRNPAGVQLLAEIYGSTSDVNIKRAIINSFASHGGADGSTDKLAEIVKTEKDPKLRAYAIQMLGGQRAAATGDMLATMYASEQELEIKFVIIDTLASQRNGKALVALARAEKDPKMKQRIVERLAGIKSPEATDYLMEILK